MTQGERMSALDKAFDKSMAEFDGMIASTRATAAEEQAEQRGAGGEMASNDSEQGNYGRGGEQSQQGQNQGQQGNPASGSGNPQTPSSGTTQGGGWGDQDEQASSGKRTTVYDKQGGVSGKASDVRPPADIPDGHDDDIVARQIREAAMKEKDPKLRAKLWDEYRKYKKSQ